jgi:hypothetical protein
MKRRKSDSLDDVWWGLTHSAAPTCCSFKRFVGGLLRTHRPHYPATHIIQRTTPARGEVVEAAPLFYIARFSFPSSDATSCNVETNNAFDSVQAESLR